MRLTPLPQLEASFDELAADVPAAIGIAIARPGLTEVCSLGGWSSGVAWSTIKVPLAIATLRRDQRYARDLVVKAITESDNQASEELWSRLGEPTGAARQVQAVVNECGDTSTVVQSQRIRPGFTAFGQTPWALVDQARFAAHLARIPDAADVVALMRQLVAEQRWGLAAKGVAVKGGWGPGLREGYLVRQFGFVSTDSGDLGVALAAEARGFEAGIDVVNAMTDWLAGHLPALTER